MAVSVLGLEWYQASYLIPSIIGSC